MLEEYTVWISGLKISFPFTVTSLPYLIFPSRMSLINTVEVFVDGDFHGKVSQTFTVHMILLEYLFMTYSLVSRSYFLFSALTLSKRAGSFDGSFFTSSECLGSLEKNRQLW